MPPKRASTPSRVTLSESSTAFGLIVDTITDSGVPIELRLALAGAASKSLRVSGDVKNLFPELETARELQRLNERIKFLSCPSRAYINTDADRAELASLGKQTHSIEESIECPAWYGDKEKTADEARAKALRDEYKLKPKEKDELGMAEARLAAYRIQQAKTPEGIARARQSKLRMKGLMRRTTKLTDEEKEELRRLDEKYPPPSRGPKSRTTQLLEKMREEREQKRAQEAGKP